MAFLEINNVEIKGVATAVPQQIKVAKDQPFFTDIEAENFTNVTGVISSHVAPADMTLSDLCQAAAEKLFEASGWERESIDLIMFVSTSRDFYICPNTANILQNKLGLRTDCMAFDMPFACSGYVYGLSVASSMMQSGQLKRALLCVGEMTSKNQSCLDKTVWALHGDAGSATLLEYNPEAKHPMQFNLNGDGSGWEAIICREVGIRYPTTEESLKVKKYDEGIKTAEFMFAMPDSVRKVDADDYLYYATCLAGAKRYEDAIAQYEHVLAMDDVSENKKYQADRAIVSTITTQVTELRQLGDYDKAIATIEPVVQRYRDKGTQNDNLMIAYATIYTDWAAELNGLERMDAIRNAVKVFNEAAEHSELNANMFLHRCCYYSMALDPELKEGLGMQYAQKLVKNLDGKADIEAGEKRYLLLGYEYMMRHEYFIKKNKKAAISWADKMLDVDPTNELALRFITALGG